MNDKLKKIIEEEIVKLPIESQKVINSYAWEIISVEIGKKYLLTENERNELQVEIALVLLGIVEEEYLSSNIENRVGTNKEEAEKITEEINQKIFIPMLEKRNQLIKESLQTKDQNWKKTIAFIILGGDYSVFIDN